MIPNIVVSEDKKDITNKNEGEVGNNTSLDGLKAKKDVIEDIPQNSSDNQSKVFSLSFNPLFIVIASIVLGLLIFGLFRLQKSEGVDVAVDVFIQNIKENEYSEVEIQDTGKVIGSSRYIDVVDVSEEDINADKYNDLDEGKTDVSNKYEDYKNVSLEEFVTKLEIPSLKDVFQSGLKKNPIDLVEQVIIGEDYIIGKVINSDGNDYYVSQTSEDSFKDELLRQGKSEEELQIDVVYTRTAAKDSKFVNFDKEFENGKYSDVWIANNRIVALIKEENTYSHVIDTASLRTDFPKLLQDAGITFDSQNVRIYSVAVPSLDFGLIIQIASMLFIGFLVYSIMKGMNGGGKGLMQFGQSKAKIFFGKKPEVTFKDVAGIDSAKEELNEVVMFLKDPKRFLKLGARIPKGLLMVGSPGTGKTLLARAIAGEAGVPFFHTSGSEFEEMLVGAGASRVRDLFAKAKKASPALIFIDEIDAVARKRGTTVQSSSTEQTLNQILVEMDGFEKSANVIIIAATNRPDVLDPAILRPGRFDRRIVIDLPDITGREEILKIHSKNKPLSSDVDLKTVARRTVGHSGADLENVLNESAIITAKDDRSEITFKDIEEASNRVEMGRERKLERTEKEIEKTAYHEAGHAIIAKLTPESDPVHRITIVSRGMALGVTMQLPERDKYSQSYTEMESRLRVLMGGRAAEEIMYGHDKITSGASNDIEKATGLARRMVKQFGYSEKLGLVKYGQSNELQYLGYGYGEQSDYSGETAKIIDEEVKRIIDEAYADAVKILKEQQTLLDQISKDLIKKEIIEGEEFNKYFEK